MLIFSGKALALYGMIDGGSQLSSLLVVGSTRNDVAREEKFK